MSKKDEKKDEEKKTPEAQQPETAPETETPQEEAAPEKTEAEALQEKLNEANDKYLRMLAEYDNYRRRSQKERESIYADVRADTVKKLLPVYDNLARAAAQEPTEDARKGMEAILTQFKSILTGLGVTEIEAVGKKFDPALHEALLHVEDEKYGEGEIVMELEKGFMLGDKVIRFSKVQVAN
jgi:molecular chaperone GrpE